MAAHELLDQAIFEGMKADHDEAAARMQARERGIERALELAELVIDADAQCLEYPGGRMLVSIARRTDSRDHLRELQRTQERLVLPVRDDSARNAPREAFLAVVAENS